MTTSRETSYAVLPRKLVPTSPLNSAIVRKSFGERKRKARKIGVVSTAVGAS